jgi:hypothetical protein
MKESNQPIRIKARWDHSEVPTGVSNQRGLLLEIDASKPVSTKKKKRRPSVNLAIVIDRSGSMHHGRLDAAKEAAIGIVINHHRQMIMPTGWMLILQWKNTA